MDKPALTDPALFPDAERLGACLVKATSAYVAWQGALDERGLAIDWKFYKDGNAWLGKVAGRKAAVCWIAPLAGAFRVTFYFTEKHLEGIAAIGLPTTLAASIAGAERIGKLIPATVEVRAAKELKAATILLDYKLGRS